jgi:hypothetical protein
MATIVVQPGGLPGSNVGFCIINIRWDKTIVFMGYRFGGLIIQNVGWVIDLHDLTVPNIGIWTAVLELLHLPHALLSAVLPTPN